MRNVLATKRNKIHKTRPTLCRRDACGTLRIDGGDDAVLDLEDVTGLNGVVGGNADGLHDITAICKASVTACPLTNQEPPAQAGERPILEMLFPDLMNRLENIQEGGEGEFSLTTHYDSPFSIYVQETLDLTSF